MKLDVSGTLVAYGTETWPEAEPAVACELPLLLHTVPHAVPAALRQDASPAGQMAALEAHLLSLCRPWDALTRGLVSGYFAFVADEIARNAPAIAERLARYDGLYEPAHVMFQAPLPLPRAHLPGPGAGRHVRVDLAFGLAGGWIGLVAEQGDLMPARARARREELASAGIRVAAVSTADLADAPGCFARLFGDDEPFWAAASLPCGPFAPDVAL